MLAEQSVKPTSRSLKPDDFDRVIAIDEQESGRARRQFFEKRLQAALAHPDRFIAVAVDRNGELAGYAIARLQGGEFGEADPGAVIEVIGVDAAARGHGIGHALLDGLNHHLRRRAVTARRTQIDWQARNLIGFFAGAGFAVSPDQVLESPVARIAPAEDADDEPPSPRLDAGIAPAILAQLMTNLEALRVERIRTRVGWNQFPLLRFLDASGFAPAQHLVLRQAVPAA
ncbi:MAG: GNAT family N-acetyltransferase [Rhodospirillaceae bacterium]